MPGEYGFVITANNLVSAKMAEAGESIRGFESQASISTKHVTEHFNTMGERMGETFKNLKSLLLTGLGITAIFEGWELIEKSKVKFEELEKSITKVDTVLKSTKFSAGFTSLDIQNQSKELSKQIVNQRDEILKAQGTLLSNTNIKGDTFKRAIQAAADYSTFKGTDLNTSAFLIGRSLQDPIQGMNQIKRMGIILNAQQKEHIKNYEKQGNIIAAQAIILDEINKKYGGQAAAYALTDAGKIQVASKAFTELQYKIGEVISRVEVSLIPSFIRITEVLKGAFDSDTIQFLISHIKDLISIVLRLIPIWATYKTIMLLVNGAQAAFVTWQKLVALWVGNTTIVVDGAIVSLEGFSAALASTGIGALVVAIGFAIEGFIEMNRHLDQATEKMFNIQEISTKYQETAKNVKDVTAKAPEIFKKHKDPKDDYSKEEQQAYVNQIAQMQRDLKTDSAVVYHKALETANIHRDSLIRVNNKAMTGPKPELNIIPYTMGTSFIGNAIENYELKGENKRAIAAADSTAAINKGVKSQLEILNNTLKVANKAGFKVKTQVDLTKGIEDDAKNTSLLSGASGGLGQAKEIKIYFNGPFQQNNGVKESKSQADEAIEKMTEMLNSFSDSVNSQ